MTIEITTENYNELLAQGKPMVIDFSAEWCGPCRKMAPIVDTMADKYDGQVIVGSCDVDENEELAQQFSIYTIPAIIFIKDGQPVDKSIGAVPANSIEEKIKTLL